MRKYIYGIDFGTSNSALAILDVEKNEVVKVLTTPSLLFFPKIQASKDRFDYSVGHAAVDLYVNSEMQGRFMKSIKRVLPMKGFTKTRVANRLFACEDLVALIIGFLKEQADAFVGENVKEAVIGRPVIFDEKIEKNVLAQERLAKAAKIAGLETCYFQMEPIAAAFTYERELTKDELVLVADFGGGTSDFTLMRLSPESVNKQNRREDIISKGGIYLGGDNFDSRLMWHRGTPHFGRGVKEQFSNKWLDLPLSYFTNICSWETMNFLNTTKMLDAIDRSYVFSGKNEKVKNLFTLVEQNLGYALFKEVEQTKIALTKEDRADLAFSSAGIDLLESISIEDFSSKIIHKELGQIDDYLEQYLTDNEVSYEDIDTVFMTGGTSMVRPLKEGYYKKFGKDKVKSGDNFNSVAMGLAYSFKTLAKFDAIAP